MVLFKKLAFVMNLLDTLSPTSHRTISRLQRVFLELPVFDVVQGVFHTIPGMTYPEAAQPLPHSALLVLQVQNTDVSHFQTVILSVQD